MKAPQNSGWRDFWKHNIRESCVPENAATAAEIANAWVGWFGELEDGMRILDVATGNGIVLTHAAAAARSASVDVDLTGVDLAEIDPPRHVSDLDTDVRKAKFLRGVAAEDMPFDDASFDIVTSQFGLEYARLELALAEVSRVTAQGGRLIWLAHSPESSVVRQLRGQSKEIGYLLASRGPLYFMKKLVERQRRHKDIKYSLDNLYAVFADAEQYCRKNPPAAIVSEVCREFANIVNRLRQVRINDLEQVIKTAERRLIAHRNRIESLNAAVLTPERLAWTNQLLSEHGWNDIRAEELKVGESDSTVGISIRASCRATT